jgi:hypothetical protein
MTTDSPVKTKNDVLKLFVKNQSRMPQDVPDLPLAREESLLGERS